MVFLLSEKEFLYYYFLPTKEEFLKIEQFFSLEKRSFIIVILID